jgi:hypothetical protein
MFGMLKVLPVIIALAGGGYMYHNYVISEKEKVIAQLDRNYQIAKSNSTRLEEALEVSEESRRLSEENSLLQQKSIAQLNKRNNELSEERNRYVSIFKRHDLTMLARAKPGLIEPRINKGTKQAFTTIERDSKEESNETAPNN